MKMLSKYMLISTLLFAFVGCDDDSDMAIKRVASPVVIAVEDTGADEITATIQELDKNGILDNSVGIISTPVTNLPVEVFSAGVSMGTFTTDASGKIIINYPGVKPNEFAGTYKGIAFRIKT